MKIIVDSNIVFSAILNSQGKIAQLIINGSKFFKFYTVGLLKYEIEEHKNKILKISGFTNQQFIKSLGLPVYPVSPSATGTHISCSLNRLLNQYTRQNKR